jgi:histidine ammonia-lyase
MTKSAPETTFRLGDSLTIDDAAAILSGGVTALAAPPAVCKRVEESRSCLEDLMAKGATIYGVNTGFGKLASQRVEPDALLALQENLLRSHAVGMGELLPIGISRLALALRIASLCAGYSGVTIALVQNLIEMFNRGIAPAIPAQGSVGASGDLAPLAHMALVLIGEGQAFIVGRPALDGDLRNAKPLGGNAVLGQVGLKPYRLQAKEGLSLINGTQISTAILADALVRARDLTRIADIAGAMTVEATRSSMKPFDARIQAVRPHAGQSQSAANLRSLLADSEIMPSHANCAKVQDAYSMRCMPQVHGTCRDAVEYIIGIVEREMNSATDNPLVFSDTREVISGGNFHAQPIALASDHLAAAMADLGSISERRVENLVNPDLSGLPGFLTPHPGLNSGMMLVQVLAAALVSENKALSFPASVDSIPTSANREDHVSMSTAAARKCRAIIANATRVLACELLCAAQGLDFLLPLRPGRGALAAYHHIRGHVEPLNRDRILHNDLEMIEQLILDGSLLTSVQTVTGSLA